MTKTIKIVRSATAGHTIVTVTLAESGITAVYGYKSQATAVKSAVEFATKEANKLLAQAKLAIGE